MKNLLVVFTIMFLLLGCSQFSTCHNSNNQNLFDLPEVNAGPMVVKVNDVTIHQGLFDVLSKLNPRIKAQLSNPMTRKKIIDSLVDQQLLYQASIKKGLDKDQDVLIKSLLNKHVIISNALLENEVETAMKKSYEEKKDEQFTKLKVSLIAAYFQPDKKNKKDDQKPTDAEKKVALDKINKIKSLLKTPEDFEKVAKEMSDDKITAKKGGVAGKISKNDKRFMRLGYQKLTEAAFKMKKDEISDPIELANGYYIVKVTSDPFVISYEDAKRVLGFELQNTIKQDLINNLKKEAKIEFAAQKEAPKQKVEKKALPQKLQDQIADAMKKESKIEKENKKKKKTQ